MSNFSLDDIINKFSKIGENTVASTLGSDAMDVFSNDKIYEPNNSMVPSIIGKKTFKSKKSKKPVKSVIPIARRTLVSENVTMNSDELMDWMEEKKLKNGFGKMDYDELKHIARSSDNWELKTFEDASIFGDWSFPPRKKSRDTPIIVLQVDNDGTYEVLDGKHRVAEHNYTKTPIKAWVGKFFGLTENTKHILESTDKLHGLAFNKTLQDIAYHHSKGKTSKYLKTIFQILKHEFEMGLQIEREHTNDVETAEKIAKDHLMENPYYYSKLKKAGL